MRKNAKDTDDRLVLWYRSLEPRDQQVTDPSGSIAHLLERRSELANRLANVDREVATSLAERIPDMARSLRPPVEYVLRTLNAALEQRTAQGKIHGMETDQIASMIGRICQYAIEVVGYPHTFADGVFDHALKLLVRARAAAAKPSPPVTAKSRRRR